MDQQTLLFISIFWLLAALFATPLRAAEPEIGPAPIWIDVRSADEFASGHIENAINIPYEQIGNRIGELTADPLQPLNLYCRSGNRASIAKQILEDMGYTRVNNIGGYRQAADAWAATRPATP